MTGYWCRYREPSGKRRVVFNHTEGFIDRPVVLPCGKCFGCRLERARQWAVRLTHESQLHGDNCFLTMTYDDDHIPKDYGLDKRHAQLFVKRLRQYAWRKWKRRIKFYLCGEYGDKFDRPHYHMILFNLDFVDKKRWKKERGYWLYISETLDKLWKLGHCQIGDVSFKSCLYVAGYVIDKLDGEKYEDAYVYIDKENNIYDREREFALQSLRPAIGKDWYEENYLDVYAHDRVISNGHAAKPPRYYDKLAQEDPNSGFDDVHRRRLMRAAGFGEDGTRERLVAREKCARARRELRKGK